MPERAGEGDGEEELRAGAERSVRTDQPGYVTKTVALPRLNGLSPTLESTALKLMEEAGELGRAIGKYRGLSGEKPLPEPEALRCVALELLDVAQTAITMMFVLEENHAVDIDDALRQHMEKLVERGYLRDPSPRGTCS